MKKLNSGLSSVKQLFIACLSSSLSQEQGEEKPTTGNKNKVKQKTSKKRKYKSLTHRDCFR